MALNPPEVYSMVEPRLAKQIVRTLDKGMMCREAPPLKHNVDRIHAVGDNVENARMGESTDVLKRVYDSRKFSSAVRSNSSTNVPNRSRVQNHGAVRETMFSVERAVPDSEAPSGDSCGPRRRSSRAVRIDVRRGGATK